MNHALNTVVSAIAHHGDSVPAIICIDGPAGCGKTSLANELQLTLHTAVVVHLDDLYHGWEDPFTSELFQRVRDEILLPHLRGEAIEFAPWNWELGKRDPVVGLSKADVVIVEGVGACAQPLRELATLTVFLDADAHQAIERAIARDGESLRPQLMKWLEDQTRHFARDNTRTSCDVVIS